ncbi:hypothetical protein [Costertonia aggregata]|uniref:Lipoprotein n=1 Tax=Costertonia aggregata TaxID=343403 RepID=A0A7H9ATZ6_9FLAO|nr:hypothetical protein [Costertonia aggregata]QLG46919.1 hypothetical protein HYG79_16680 [Costertonia aggregata]
MRRILEKIRMFCVASFTALSIFSCSNDADSENNSSEVSFTATELQTILETDDIAGITDSVIAEVYVNNGNTGQTAKNNDCYDAAYTDTGFTVTFNNCNLNGSDNVNGTLSVVYASTENTASFTATYTDFFVGNIKLTGTRSYSFNANADDTAYTFSVTSDITVTMADESVISESGTKTFGFAYNQMEETFVFTLSGDWTLNVDDDTYAINVTSDLEGNLGCDYLTRGVMAINKNGLEVSVDFGDGTCDDKAELTYPNGTKEDISLRD